jgi:hypothetical protein
MLIPRITNAGACANHSKVPLIGIKMMPRFNRRSSDLLMRVTFTAGIFGSCDRRELCPGDERAFVSPFERAELE